MAVRLGAATFGRMSSDPSKVTHSGHSSQCWIRPLNLRRLWLDSRTACQWTALLGRLIPYLCSELFHYCNTLVCECKVRKSNTDSRQWTFSDDFGILVLTLIFPMQVYCMSACVECLWLHKSIIHWYVDNMWLGISLRIILEVTASELEIRKSLCLPYVNDMAWHVSWRLCMAL